MTVSKAIELCVGTDKEEYCEVATGRRLTLQGGVPEPDGPSSQLLTATTACTAATTCQAKKEGLWLCDGY